MNANDLPAAARLACLIEAGVAAHPDIRQGKNFTLCGNRACALGFAALGAGATRHQVSEAGVMVCQKFLGLPCYNDLAMEVARSNDNGEPLEAICRSLREGSLAKVAV